MRLLTNVEDQMDAQSYPATCEEIIDSCGDAALEFPNGEETLGDALGRLGETTFQSADDAKLAAYSAVSKGAIGRQNYSDRDAPSIGENGPDQLSF
jgi:hypothetical protein